MLPAEVARYALYPRAKRNARNLPIVPSNQSLPGGKPDVLHDVVDVLKPTDPQEPCPHMWFGALDGSHQLINRNVRCGRTQQFCVHARKVFGWI